MADISQTTRVVPTMQLNMFFPEISLGIHYSEFACNFRWMDIIQNGGLDLNKSFDNSKVKT